MTELSVLQSGRGRRSSREARARRTRRRRQVALTAATLLLGLIALLALMSSAVTDRAARSVAKVKPPRATASSRRPAFTLHPAASQLHVKLKLPLRSGLLFDVTSGRVLWARDPSQQLPIASLTKLMTALVVVAHAKPSDLALITRAATRFTGSGVGLLPVGKRVTVLALLYGLLLPSGNDAAMALAQHVAGSVPGLIAMMNGARAQYGLRCSHFTTVSGIVDQGNYACATDLALLTHAVLEQPLLRKIVGSASAILPFPIKGRKLFLYNNNPLFYLNYPGVDGVKTGYTVASGPCLIASARRGRKWFAVVLLHSASPAYQAMQLLNAAFTSR